MARVLGLEKVEYIFEDELVESEKIRNLYRSRREKVLHRAQLYITTSEPTAWLAS